MPWPHQKPTKIISSLQMENKQLQREHINKQSFRKTCIKLLKIWPKHSPRSGSELLRIYSLRCSTQNSLQRKGSLASLWPWWSAKNRQMGIPRPGWSSGFKTETLGYFTRRHWSTSHPRFNNQFETDILHVYNPGTISNILSWIH